MQFVRRIASLILDLQFVDSDTSSSAVMLALWFVFRCDIIGSYPLFCSFSSSIGFVIVFLWYFAECTQLLIWENQSAIIFFITAFLFFWENWHGSRDIFPLPVPVPMAIASSEQPLKKRRLFEPAPDQSLHSLGGSTKPKNLVPHPATLSPPLCRPRMIFSQISGTNTRFKPYTRFTMSPTCC